MKVTNVEVVGNYLDGATESQFKIEGGQTDNISIKGNGFWAARNNRFGVLSLSNSDAPSKNLLVSGNYFIHHIQKFK